MLPALIGRDTGPIHDVSIFHSGGGVFAIRKGDWKLIHESEEGGYDEGPESGGRGQLYNLRNDPGEKKNLYSEKPDLVRQLTDELSGFKKEDIGK